MAIRNIREIGDKVLYKTSKEVKDADKKLLVLIDDMLETMYEADGVGLAAPQVGVMKRLCVIDVGEGPIVLINPEKIKETGAQYEVEGCLSVPGIYGEVKRPAKVVVKALNEKGEEIAVEGEGFLARAISHEMDHLDGVLFEDKVIRYIDVKKED